MNASPMSDILVSGTRAERLARLADRRPRIAPSLLNCDFGILQSEIASAQSAGAQIVHWDVMDGVFCPNFTYGPPLIASLRPQTNAIFDVHLMMADPARYLNPFLQAGSDIVTIHIEAVPNPTTILREIRHAGAWSGLAINPPTPVEAILPYLDEADLILIMSVMPGFGGQAFNPSVLAKISQILNLKPDCCVEIDGGIGPATIGSAAAVGTGIFVVGSAFYKSEDRAGTFRHLEDQIRRA
jgi:ribulose-phosphate 3-epimerase